MEGEEEVEEEEAAVEEGGGREEGRGGGEGRAWGNVGVGGVCDVGVRGRGCRVGGERAPSMLLSIRIPDGVILGLGRAP